MTRSSLCLHQFSLWLLLGTFSMFGLAQTPVAVSPLGRLEQPVGVAQQVAAPREDSQLWPDLQLTIRLKPTFALIGFGTARWGRDFSAHVNKQIGAGINWAVHPRFSFASQYRHVISDPTIEQHSVEERFHVDFTPRGPLGKGFQYTNRVRLEWRWINGKLSNRYRNRVQLERPLSFKRAGHQEPLSLTPYVSYEIFYDTRHKALSRRQLYVGSRVPLVKHLTFNGFYMRQSDNIARPGNLNVWGTFLQFDF